MSELGGTIPGKQLRAFIDRIERVEEAIKDLNGDKSEIYKEARNVGFDVKTIRKVVAARKIDPSEREEADSLFDIYMAALDTSLTEQPSRVHVHEAIQSSNGKVSGLEHLSAARNGATTEQDNVDSSAAARTPDGDAQTEKHHNENASLAAREGEQAAAPIPEAFQPPAFILRDKGPLRPHCLNREMCASGFPREHCHACKRAMEASGVAA